LFIIGRGAALGLEGGVGRRVVWCPSVPDVWVRCPMLTGGDFGCAAGWWGAVAKFGALFGGAAGGGAGFGRWRGAERGLVPFGARCLGSVPWVRCPMLTGGDFGCAAWWWGAVHDVAFGGEARSGGRWRRVAAYAAGRHEAGLGSVPDVDRG
jgi:hypothetical protein